MDEDPLSFFADEMIERADMPDPLQTRREHKLVSRLRLQTKELARIMPALPEPGESHHLVSDGRFDYWRWVPHLLGLLGPAAEAYVSSWTMNRQNVLEMLELFDAGKIQRLAVLTGLYFKRRESAVYAQLVTGLMARGQRYSAFANHAKVMLLTEASGTHWLTLEGSANLTGNPRLEQQVITNDRGVYQMHRTWMEQMLTRSEKG